MKKMDGDNRRKKLLNILENSEKPISGTQLAEILSVSRQVVVQDIALLRAVNKNILSTNKGYFLYINREEKKIRRSYHVLHNEFQILDELFTIVDLGGKVLDVVIEHEIYGQIMVDLMIESRADAENFVDKVKNKKAKPLNELTYGVHYHTVEADREERLIEIERVLSEKGYLINDLTCDNLSSD